MNLWLPKIEDRQEENWQKIFERNCSYRASKLESYLKLKRSIIPNYSVIKDLGQKTKLWAYKQGLGRYITILLPSVALILISLLLLTLIGVFRLLDTSYNLSWNNYSNQISKQQINNPNPKNSNPNLITNPLDQDESSSSSFKDSSQSQNSSQSSTSKNSSDSSKQSSNRSSSTSVPVNSSSSSSASIPASSSSSSTAPKLSLPLGIRGDGCSNNQSGYPRILLNKNNISSFLSPDESRLYDPEDRATKKCYLYDTQSNTNLAYLFGCGDFFNCEQNIEFGNKIYTSGQPTGVYILGFYNHPDSNIYSAENQTTWLSLLHYTYNHSTKTISPYNLNNFIYTGLSCNWSDPSSYGQDCFGDISSETINSYVETNQRFINIINTMGTSAQRAKFQSFLAEIS